jgi:hypothetical protein
MNPVGFARFSDYHMRRVKIDPSSTSYHMSFTLTCCTYRVHGFYFRLKYTTLSCFTQKKENQSIMSVNDSNTGNMASTKKKHFIPLGTTARIQQTERTSN